MASEQEYGSSYEHQRRAETMGTASANAWAAEQARNDMDTIRMRRGGGQATGGGTSSGGGTSISSIVFIGAIVLGCLAQAFLIPAVAWWVEMAILVVAGLILVVLNFKAALLLAALAVAGYMFVAHSMSKPVTITQPPTQVQAAQSHKIARHHAGK